MSTLENVHIVISQSGNTVATLDTDENGNADVVLSAGSYQITFTYTGRNPVVYNVTLTDASTKIMFAMPLTTLIVSPFKTIPEFSQTADVECTQYKMIITVPIMTNT